jgi:hypothetical protein
MYSTRLKMFVDNGDADSQGVGIGLQILEHDRSQVTSMSGVVASRR